MENALSAAIYILRPAATGPDPGGYHREESQEEEGEQKDSSFYCFILVNIYHLAPVNVRER